MPRKLSPLCAWQSLTRFAWLLGIPVDGCTIQYATDRQGNRLYRCRDPSGWDGNCGWLRLPGGPPPLPPLKA